MRLYSLKIFTFIALATITSLSVNAQVGLTFERIASDAGYVVGDTVNISVFADSSLTGKGALALTTKLTYNDYYIVPVSVNTDSTILKDAGWSVIPNLSDPDVISIAAAGTNELSGSGRLFSIDFKLVRQGTGYIYFDKPNTFFNESVDDVPIIYNNDYGQVSIGAKPTINVSLANNGVIVLGDSVQAYVSGQEDPTIWSVTDTSLASIKQNGIVQSKSFGTVGVIAEDNRGVRDSSDLKILGFELTGKDTTNFQGQEVAVHVNASDLTTLNAQSGSFFLNTNVSDNFEVLGIDAGELLDPSANITYNVQSNGISIAFAQTGNITGAGRLLTLNLKYSDSQTFQNYTTFSNVLINEDLEGGWEPFYIRSNALPSLSISNTGSTNNLVGDSLQFSVANNTGSVIWNVSNNSLATIDDSGKLITQKGGSFFITAEDSIGATANTSNFTFYDVFVQLPDTSMILSDTIYYPVNISNLERSGSSILSSDITFSYSNTQLNYLGYSLDGSLTEGWSFAENKLSDSQVKLVGGGVNEIEQSGNLMYLIFKVDTSIATDRNSYLYLNDILFNEGAPNYKKDDGRIFISSKPLMPELLSPTNGAQGVELNATLDWGNGVGATSYNVQLSQNTSFTNLIADTSGVLPTELAVSDLSGSTNYYWRVQSVNTGGTSNWTSYYSFRTQDPIPETPVNTSPADGATDQPLTTILGWTGVTFATEYRVELSANSDFSTILLDSTVSSSQTTMLLPDLDYDVIYYWRVYASNTTGESGASIATNFKTEDGLPETPVLSSPEENASNLDTLITFEWQSAIDADGYEIQVGPDSLFTNLVLRDSVVTTSYTDKKFEFNTSYFWRVRAYNTVGTSEWATMRKFSIREQEPEVPLLISPANGDTEVDTLTTFVWNKAARASGYTIQISEDDLFSSLKFEASSSDTIQSVAGLEFLTEYFWRVKAVNSGGESAFSTVRSFTVKAEDASIPEPLSPANNEVGVDTSATLIWSTATGAVNYQVQVSTALDFSTTTNDFETTDTTFEASTLNFETEYFWRVRGIGAADTSDWSPVFIFTTTFDKPEAPVLVSPIDNTNDIDTLATFVWNSVKNAEVYIIQLSESSLFESVLVEKTVSDTLKSIGGFSFQSTYYWRVKATNSAGESPFSTINTFTVKAEDASIPEPLSPANNEVGVDTSATLIWSTATGAVNYQVQVSTALDFSTTTNDFETTDTTFEASTLNFETEYFWRVRGIGAADTSDWSPVFTFTTRPEALGIPLLISPADEAENVPDSTEFIWSLVQGANQYLLEVDTDTSLTGSQIFTVNDTSKVVGDLEFEQTYYWRVRAKVADSELESEWSERNKFTTKEAPESSPVVNNPLGSVTLNEDFGEYFAGSLDSVFTDDQEEGLVYELISTTINIEVKINSDSLLIISIQDSSGVNEVVVKATDIDGLSIRDTLTVTILPVNDIPYFEGLADSVSFTNNTPGEFDFLNKVKDVETPFEELSISAKVTPDDISFSVDKEAGLITLTSNDFTGEGVLTFTVKDADGDSVSTEVTLIVSLGTSNERESDIPLNFTLSQNYPNPFNPTSTIKFGIPEAAVVKLEIYNLLGQKVKTLLNARRSAGFHTVNFDATNLSSGMYMYRIQAGNFVKIKKMTLIK